MERPDFASLPVHERQAAYEKWMQELKLATGHVESPGLLEQAGSAAKALIDWTVDGFRLCSRRHHRARMKVCRGCPYLQKGTCVLCGCPFKRKSRAPAFHCPHPEGDKWAKVDKRFLGEGKLGNF